MWHFIKLYTSVTVIYLIIDFLWLGILMSGFYKSQLGILARRAGDSLTPIWWAAILVYLLVPLAIILLVLPRAQEGGTILWAIAWGLFFGVVVYGVYDLTNYAILNNWPVKFMIVDILWGGIVCAILSLAVFFLDKIFR